MNIIRVTITFNIHPLGEKEADKSVRRAASDQLTPFYSQLIYRNYQVITARRHRICGRPAPHNIQMVAGRQQ